MIEPASTDPLRCPRPPAPNTLTIEQRVLRPGVAVVTVCGEIDLATEDALRAALAPALADPHVSLLYATCPTSHSWPATGYPSSTPRPCASSTGPPCE
jgi:hypothetical protein